MDLNSKVSIGEIKFSLISQKFNDEKINDVEKEIFKELDQLNIKDKIRPNMKIAVTSGSRGIANIVTITRAVCDYIKLAGGIPTIIPSMGSHGGATAEGQKKVLTELGITEKSMECDIKSSMEVVKVGETVSNVPVYLDKEAYHSDGIVVINRIKPHTDFDSDIESGLIKMIAVGLGNSKGCSTMHTFGLSRSIPEAARISMKNTNIIFGLGIIENSKDETYKLKAILPEEIEEQEKKLLVEAKKTVPKLPIDELDVLVVREMGKMISGTGMDTKVIGRIKVLNEVEPLKPEINKVVILNLAKNSYGNALGVGLADITTRKLVDSIDFEATYANIIATSFLERGKIPITMSSDEEAITVAIDTAGDVDSKNIKIGIIENTLNLQKVYLSEGALKHLDGSKSQVLENNIKLKFDKNGNLI